MNGVNLSATIAEKRREKGITQDELAAYIGVTKAAVSKWETGHCFPDIAFLPVLAAYFDISIDDLIGYSPQMTEKGIDKLYQQLALDFTTKPFDEVIAECEAVAKKYYSCYPLLFRLAVLYLNHAPMAADQNRSEQVITEAIRFCERVSANSKDRELAHGAVNIQASCHLSLKDGGKVLELLEESSLNTSAERTLIAQAHQLLGDEKKAQETLQVDLYEKLMEMFQSLMVILQSNLNNLETVEPVYVRAEGLANLFNMKCLNCNNMAMMYLLGAQMYQTGGLPEKATMLVAKYVDTCVHGFFPFTMQGDDFFDKLDNFLPEDGGVVPRSDTAIKNDMMQYLHNPVFDSLRESPEFKKAVAKLEKFIRAEGLDTPNANTF